MASQIASLEEDKRAYQEQLDIVQTQRRDDPENAELSALQEELEGMIALLDESIADLKPKQAPQKASPPPPPPPGAPPQPKQEKWSRENHPAFNKQIPAAPQAVPADDKDEKDSQTSYQVNDDVLAKWLSGDKKFWPARIMSITGSSTAPIYIVKFKNYKGTETLRAKDIRPASNKRKADGPPAVTTSSSSAPSGSGAGAGVGVAAAWVGEPPSSISGTGPSSGVVMSSAPSLYPEQPPTQEAEKNTRDVQGRPPKAKKIKAKKELEAGKNKWQEFNSKSKFGRSHKKDSMFRTPEGIHGRVGFTGSGQAMRKDPTRSRHVYQTTDDMD